MKSIITSVLDFILKTLTLFLIFIGFCYLCDWFMTHPVALAVVAVAGFLAVLYHKEVTLNR